MTRRGPRPTRTFRHVESHLSVRARVLAAVLLLAALAVLIAGAAAFVLQSQRTDAHIDLYNEANNLLAALANVPPLPPKAQVERPTKHPARVHRALPDKPLLQPKIRNTRPVKRALKPHNAPPAKRVPKANPQKTKPRTKRPAPARPAAKGRRK